MILIASGRSPSTLTVGRPLAAGHTWVWAVTPAATARSTRSRPAPLRGRSGSSDAVLRTSAFSESGVASGNFCSRSAAAPDMTAAACDVPEPRMIRSSMMPTTAVLSMNEPGERKLRMETPGAATSMRRAVGSTGPEVNGARVSSSKEAVPFGSSAPTVSTKGSYAGDASGPDPAFPAATTTTIPAFQARSTATASGSST